MKITHIIAGVFLAGVLFTACNKEVSVDNAAAPQALQTSTSGALKIGQPVTVTMNNVPQGSSVAWSVMPDSNYTIVPSGNAALFRFTKKGTYTVTGRFGNATATTSFFVGDSTYDTTVVVNPVDTAINFAANDKIQLTAYKIDTVGVNVSGIYFAAATLQNYSCLNNSLAVASNMNSDSLFITFKGVVIPSSNCVNGQTTAKNTIYFYPLTNGVKTLVFKMNGVSYTGTITKNGSSYTIVWPNTTAISISPLQL